MLRSLHQITDIYRQFFATNFAEATSYRLHFFLLILMDLFFYTSVLGSVAFIFDHVATVGPWQKGEFMFFLAFMLAIDQMHMTLVSEGFWQFSQDIRTGNLDFVLLKPAPSLFLIFCRHIRPASMLMAPVAWGLVIYHGIAINLDTWAWFALPPFLLIGFVLIVAIEVLVAMSMFWIIESFGINFLRMQLQNISRWPDFIFRFTARKFFTIFVPVLLAGSVPIKILIGELNPMRVSKLLIAIAILGVLIRWFWQAGLRRYESASS